MTDTQVNFYNSLVRETDFSRLGDPERFRPVPEEWLLAVSDIKGSTALVAEGKYKTVNMVGAAVISAVMNAIGNHSFPFVFGGDGASMAVAPEHEETVRLALAAVARWAESEFGIEMRIAVVPVAEARAAGHDVRVARFAVSDAADYAMFAGGGLLWAETQMKAGAHTLEKAPPGTFPDLTGLSCRWANMRSDQGNILSLVVAAVPGAPEDETSQVFAHVIALAESLARGGHPAPATGMEARRAPRSAQLEAHAARGTGPLASARRKAAFESLVYWVLYKLKLSVGGFDPRHFARAVAANADFRKLDDGLKMTLDCDRATQEQLETLLAQAAADGLVRYGITVQEEAMMTCIVPSPLTEDHLHFIDGAAGGYTKAASIMKGT